MLNRLLCWWFGHKRGKLIMVLNTAEIPKNRYKCPRCHSTWDRKQRRK
jgi:transposase-like protein